MERTRDGDVEPLSSVTVVGNSPVGTAVPAPGRREVEVDGGGLTLADRNRPVVVIVPLRLHLDRVVAYDQVLQDRRGCDRHVLLIKVDPGPGRVARHLNAPRDRFEGEVDRCVRPFGHRDPPVVGHAVAVQLDPDRVVAGGDAGDRRIRRPPGRFIVEEDRRTGGRRGHLDRPDLLADREEGERDLEERTQEVSAASGDAEVTGVGERARRPGLQEVGYVPDLVA